MYVFVCVCVCVCLYTLHTQNTSSVYFVPMKQSFALVFPTKVNSSDFCAKGYHKSTANVSTGSKLILKQKA